MKFTWNSFKKVLPVKTVGSVLQVNLPLLGMEAVPAKVDTGAFSGALHAGRIREVVDKQGIKHLRFAPLFSKDHTIEIDSYHKRKVKSSNGVVSMRYAIDTEIQIQDHVYPITLTLTDRRKMKYPMLVGRNFLRLHGFLVDVGQRKQ